MKRRGREIVPWIILAFIPLVMAVALEPEADIDGVHFQKNPAGENIRCSFQPDVFKDLAADNDENRLKFFSNHSKRRHDIASDMRKSRSRSSDELVHVRYRSLFNQGLSSKALRGNDN